MMDIYKYNELLQLVDEDECTIAQAIKDLRLGTTTNHITTFTQHEIKRLKLHLTHRDRIDYLKITNYLKDHQPMKLFSLQEALEDSGLYYRVPVLIDKYTPKDDNLWEDDNDFLYYGYEYWNSPGCLMKKIEKNSDCYSLAAGEMWW